MKKFYLILILFFCSSLYASEKPFTIEYSLTNSPEPEITHTKSITTVLLSNNAFEMPGREEDKRFGDIDILITPISNNELLVSNTFTVEGKEYTPEMTVILGEEAVFTVENVSLAIRVSAYVPDVVN